ALPGAPPPAPPGPPVLVDVPPVADAGLGKPPSSIVADWPTLDVLSARYIRRVLAHVGGNQSRAARLLGVNRRTVSRVVTGALGGGDPVTQRRHAVQGRRGVR